MEDRRKRKTKKAIHQAFSTLIQQKSIDKISVTELCKLADISKSTFYLHYHDIYDYADVVADQIMDSIFSILESYNFNALIEHLDSILSEIVDEAQDIENNFIPFLTSPHLAIYTSKRKEKLIEHILENESSNAFSKESKRMTTIFLISGILSILESYQYQQLDKESIEDICQQLRTGFHCVNPQ